jgi:hypothetical protein
MLEKLIGLSRSQTGASPDQLDLNNAHHLSLATSFADDLLALGAPPGDYQALEAELVTRKDEVPLLVHLAAKLAIARSLVLNWSEPAHLSVVFAVYKEHQRILTGEQVPGGEDFLRRKVQQLAWLFAGRNDLTWDMFVVDDGCPEGSGRIAGEIIAQEGLGDRVRVLFLAEAIEQGLPVVSPLADTSESMKGGSVELGLWTAALQEKDNHVVIFTDADLSTHLGQSGLLMDRILQGGMDAAIGSRRQTESVVIKKGSRNTRGKLFIYLWKRIINLIPEIIDTQCGFKGFRADVVRGIVPDMLEKKFAFDIELLIKTRLRRSHSIDQVGIAWIDSDALSTTTDIQPYLPMLKAMVGMYRHYLEETALESGFADFIDGLDEAAWERLQNNIPSGITDREPAEFVDYCGVTVEDLQRACSE